jgi:hypothetical protein
VAGRELYGHYQNFSAAGPVPSLDERGSHEGWYREGLAGGLTLFCE